LLSALQRLVNQDLARKVERLALEQV
jgi:hypothetical protein